MKKHEITHIDSDSTALLCALLGCINATIAVLLGIIFLPSSGGLNLLLFFIIAAIIGALIGSIVGVVTAELYNYLTNWTGGVVVRVENASPEQATEMNL